MHSSPVFSSSSYCEPSPDGQLVAALNASALTVRSVKTLSLVNAIEISPGPVGAKTSFIWAPSSAKILVSIADQIQIFSVCDASFQVSVQNPLFSHVRPSSIHFGAVDTEVFVCSAVGLKFVILDLSTLKTVQVSNPKFFYPYTATRGFCLSPDTGHLALLTRANGKDFVSIHAPGSRRLQRSWSPNLVDAQGLIWAPDNRWLLLWESPAHAFRLLLYTPDGQQFRSIDALALSDSLSSASDIVFGAGIKACHLSPDAQLCAVSGYSRGIAVLDTQSWRECLKLLHPTAIIPRDTVQVWQEQLAAVDGKLALRPFVRAAMTVAPPGISSDAKKGKNAETGCSLAGFDASSTLLAARLDDSPSTIWIWDTAVAELRAVLIFYSHVSFTWHPARRELLLVTCQDEARRGTSFVWDPLSNGPVSVRPDDHLPPATAAGKPQLSWVSCDAELPKLLVADAEHYRLLVLSGPEDEPNSWHDNEASDWSAESDDGTSALEDTFSFRKTELEGGS